MLANHHPPKGTIRESKIIDIWKAQEVEESTRTWCTSSLTTTIVLPANHCSHGNVVIRTQYYL